MIEIIILLSAFFISTILAALIIPRIVKFAYKNNLFDLPSNRKLHSTPIPRLGGVCFTPVAISVFATFALVLFRSGVNVSVLWNEIAVQHLMAYVVGALLLFACGLVDDISALGYKIKFMVQFGAAFSLCAGGLWIANFEHILWIDTLPYWVGMPITIFFVVYLTNAINLIDGIDGLASGLSCISLVVITVLNIISNNFIWALFSICFLGAVTAFFYYNVFSCKYKVFMGDTGSLSLGFVLSFLILHFWQDGLVWNLHMHNIGIVAISTLVIPLFDVVRVMMSRLRDGRNPFLPDKNHIHHKLMRAGLSGSMTMLVILAMSMFIIALNYFLASEISQTLILIADVILFVVMHLVINIFIFRKEDGKVKWNRAF